MFCKHISVNRFDMYKHAIKNTVCVFNPIFGKKYFSNLSYQTLHLKYTLCSYPIMPNVFEENLADICYQMRHRKTSK